LIEFDPRGSKCPICKSEFRTGCKHSVTQAHERLRAELARAEAAMADFLD
jgi:hypothetical protein